MVLAVFSTEYRTLKSREHMLKHCWDLIWNCITPLSLFCGSNVIIAGKQRCYIVGSGLMLDDLSSSQGSCCGSSSACPLLVVPWGSSNWQLSLPT